MQEIIPTLNDRQRDILREKGYYDLAENVQNIANCAMLLAINYVKQATDYAESCGGGGVSNLSGWGQKKDEDDVQWWVRCIATASAGGKTKRSQEDTRHFKINLSFDTKNYSEETHFAFFLLVRNHVGA
jgi:hypothetical protein